MTPAQEKKYWREWGALTRFCKANHLPAPDRHELHVRALGTDRSHKDFTNDEFTKWLAEVWAITKPDAIKPQLRQITMPRKNALHRIQIEQVKLLAILLSTERKPRWQEYPPEFPVPAEALVPDLDAAMTFVATVMRERFRTEDITLISDAPQPRFVKKFGKLVLRDGQPIHTGDFSDLELLRDTLDARINALRNKRGGADPKAKRKVHTVPGWTIHELHQAAGVKCPDWCSSCYPRRKRAVVVEREEVLEHAD